VLKGAERYEKAIGVSTVHLCEAGGYRRVLKKGQRLQRQVKKNGNGERQKRETEVARWGEIFYAKAFALEGTRRNGSRMGKKALVTCLNQETVGYEQDICGSQQEGGR